MSILPLLRVSGSLSLAEINMRSRESPEDILAQLRALKSEGLVEVEGGVPETAAGIAIARTKVRLTHAGTRRAFQ